MSERPLTIQISRRWLRITTLLAAAALLLVPVVATANHNFSDVPPDAFYHDDVDALFDHGVTAGYPDGTYRPNQDVTRGEMATFLNALGALGPGETPVVNAATVQGLGLFADVVEFTVNNDEVPPNEEECVPAQSALGPDHAFGTFFVSYQLFEMPGDAGAGPFTFDVNVQLRRPTGHPEINDPADYLVCFALLDESGVLPSGTYKLFRIEAHEQA